MENASWKLGGTNLANFGSAPEKDTCYQEGTIEPAWSGPNSPIGKVPGFWIWRIEQFKVVPWPVKDYGKFFSGDSYLILRSRSTEGSNVLTHDIHFWLGLKTSQDEAGTAAYKTVELDDYLDGTAIQYREIQSNESALFVSYFKRLVILEGGTESGFRRQEEKVYQKRLLRLHKPNFSSTRTQNTVVITQMPLTYQSLNSGDVFVLDTGNTIYQFQGRKSQGIERAKAAELITHLKEESGGQPKVVIVEQGDKGMEDFWDALGSEGPIKEAEIAEREADRDAAKAEKVLFRLSTGSGGLKFDRVASGTVSKDMFKSNKVYIFDVGHEVIAWIGKNSNPQAKKMALQYAMEYIRKYNRPPYLTINRIFEGAENEHFASLLAGWKGW